MTNRLQEAADEIVHTLCRVSATIAMRGPTDDPIEVAEAVTKAYRETGDAEDEEGLEQAAMRVLRGEPVDPGPTLDELLEGFWGGKDPGPWQHEDQVTVWVLKSTYEGVIDPDIQVYHCKEAALWQTWFDMLDDALLNGLPEEQTATEWLAGRLTKLQDLRDYGCHSVGYGESTLQEFPVQ